jgi:rhamnulokinase
MSAVPPTYIAVDLGAESARVMAGTVTDTAITVEERSRVTNQPVPLPDRLAWNMTGLFDAAVTGIAGVPGAKSVGVDGWGVDVGLLRADGSLCALPRSYRDPITAGVLPALWARVEPARLYARTGIQMMEINTLAQFVAWKQAGLRELEEAHRFLLLPDLLNYWLGGEAVGERTNASTTQLLGIGGEWDRELCVACDISPDMCPPLVAAGTVLGRVRHALHDRVHGAALKVVAVASHDTASAVVGTTLGPGSAFISSGTWSLVGVESETPIVSELARRCNLSNERGAGATFRVLRNVMGMWLLQRCRSIWTEDGGALSHAQVLDLASGVDPFGPVIDPDDPRLLRAADVAATVRLLCQESGQSAPDSRGATVRCILESLALRYRWTLSALSACSGRSIENVHVVGGGSRNQLLCRMTAAATRLPVLAGPVEATALGNIVIQAIADGTVGSIADGRQLIENSLPSRLYPPEADDRWDAAYARFCSLESVGAPPDRARGL